MLKLSTYICFILTVLSSAVHARCIVTFEKKDIIADTVIVRGGYNVEWVNDYGPYTIEGDIISGNAQPISQLSVDAASKKYTIIESSEYTLFYGTPNGATGNYTYLNMYTSYSDASIHLVAGGNVTQGDIYSELVMVQALLDQKCGNEMTDECGQPLEIPAGQHIISLSEAASSPVLSGDIEEAVPLGLGTSKDSIGRLNSGDRLDMQLGLCPFDVAVDIYLYFSDERGFIFFLAWDGTISTLLDGIPQPYLANVTEKVEVDIPDDFGGLFADPNHLPLGQLEFGVLVTRTGDLSDLYVWQSGVNSYCKNDVSLPAGVEIYLQEELPLSVSGDEASVMNPLSFGPYALNRNSLMEFSVNFCGYESSVDLFFGVYVPSIDPGNILFLSTACGANLTGISDVDDFSEALWTEVPLQQAATRMPDTCWTGSTNFDDAQHIPEDILKGFPSRDNTGLIRPDQAYYLVAVSPAGVRDRFHAWIVPFGLDLMKYLTDSHYDMYKQ